MSLARRYTYCLQPPAGGQVDRTECVEREALSAIKARVIAAAGTNWLHDIRQCTVSAPILFHDALRGVCADELLCK